MKAVEVTRKITLAILVLCLVLSIPPARADQAPTPLGEIVFTGTKTHHTLEDVPVETLVITAEEIAQKNSQTIMDLLATVPGIQTGYHNDVFGTYSWLAKMRGLPFDSGYGLVLVDGQRSMGCGQSGGMGEYGIGLNQIPVSMVDRIEVVKGPGSALYGSDAMAGVINIITKKAPEKATGRAGVAYGWYDVKREKSDGSTEDAHGSRNHSQAYLSYGDRLSENWGYLLHYTHESADDIASDPVRSDRHAFMGKLDGRVNDRTDLFLKYETGTYEKEDVREEDSQRLCLGVDFHLAPAHTLSIKGYTYDWDFSHGYPGYAYGFKEGDVGYDQAEVQYTWEMADWNTLVVGGEAQLQKIGYTIENDDGTTVTVDEDVKTKSLYIQDEARLFDRITLVAGGRYDDHSTFGDEVNPKVSLMYKPQRDTTLRASFGTSYKSPTIRQLYYSAPYRHGSFYAQSNPDLKPEKGKGYSASLEQWFFNRMIMVDLGCFRNEVDDMVVREDTGTLYNDLPLMKYKNVEEAITQGIEFMAKACFTDAFTTTLSYTYTATENKETGKDLTYVPRHSAALSPAYGWEKYGVEASATLSFNGKQYTNAGNTQKIDAGTKVDAKLQKHLSQSATLSLEADDIFDSCEGREGRFHAGRTLTLKLDLMF